MGTEIEIGAVVVLAQALGVLALWLRLRWRVRREQLRARAAVDLIKALSAGGDVEEQRSDGSRLRLSVSARRSQGNHG